MLVEQEVEALGDLFPLLEISDSVTIDESDERALLPVLRLKLKRVD